MSPEGTATFALTPSDVTVNQQGFAGADHLQAVVRGGQVTLTNSIAWLP